MSPLTCEQCCAPLGRFIEGGHATCDYCGAVANVSAVIEKGLREQLRILRKQWDTARLPLMVKGPRGQMLPPTNDFERDSPFVIPYTLVWISCLFGSALMESDLAWIVVFAMFFLMPLLGKAIDARCKRKKRDIYKRYKRLRSDYAAERTCLVKEFENASETD